ncbi:HAD hydrolase-like protein [Paenibacillus thalictri]|uniref:HAD family hydrolase n=1 Tax=Paenibacillus thalictri TaxID=2527873 RepID=A0A4Q9DID1_9BACL|nr:HAD hydrolase-like protein [Paenibacillus thalictri]TBL70392.1 HAD family hydrolase [Paenibacillus thalictri]
MSGKQRQRRYEGIIFDMDNTLIGSRIEFGRMKFEVHKLLCKHRILETGSEPGSHTTVTLIDSIRGHERFTQEVEFAVWQRIADIEEEGMVGARLEEGVLELLERLKGRIMLTVLTNNAGKAAQKALQETGIEPFFSEIVSRDGLRALKPAPDGVAAILNRYPETSPSSWLSVGDSWTDGLAAQTAGVPFVAYGGNPAVMTTRGVKPLAYIQDIRELLYLLEM